jgi:hypothetical protein
MVKVLFFFGGLSCSLLQSASFLAGFLAPIRAVSSATSKGGSHIFIFMPTIFHDE